MGRVSETADGVPWGNTHSACTFQLTKLFLETTSTNTHPSEPRMSASPLFPARVDDQARTSGKNGSCKTEPYVFYEIKVRPDLDLSVLATGAQAWRATGVPFLSCREVSRKHFTRQHQGNTMWGPWLPGRVTF